jgi:hypothetical protein
MFKNGQFVEEKTEFQLFGKSSSCWNKVGATFILVKNILNDWTSFIFWLIGPVDAF